eukprot:470640_1
MAIMASIPTKCICAPVTSKYLLIIMIDITLDKDFMDYYVDINHINCISMLILIVYQGKLLWNINIYIYNYFCTTQMMYGYYCILAHKNKNKKNNKRKTNSYIQFMEYQGEAGEVHETTKGNRKECIKDQKQHKQQGKNSDKNPAKLFFF